MPHKFNKDRSKILTQRTESDEIIRQIIIYPDNIPDLPESHIILDVWQYHGFDVAVYIDFGSMDVLLDKYTAILDELE